jgi:hypothetical protein
MMQVRLPENCSEHEEVWAGFDPTKVQYKLMQPLADGDFAAVVSAKNIWAASPRALA